MMRLPGPQNGRFLVWVRSIYGRVVVSGYLLEPRMMDCSFPEAPCNLPLHISPRSRKFRSPKLHQKAYHHALPLRPTPRLATQNLIEDGKLFCMLKAPRNASWSPRRSVCPAHHPNPACHPNHTCSNSHFGTYHLLETIQEIPLMMT